MIRELSQFFMLAQVTDIGAHFISNPTLRDERDGISFLSSRFISQHNQSGRVARR